VRPGERITFDAVIESVSTRKTTALGAGYFVTMRMDIRASSAGGACGDGRGGELVGTHRFRILKYEPRAAKPQPTAKAAPAGHRRPRRYLHAHRMCW
jgi:hypothetical protein